MRRLLPLAELRKATIGCYEHQISQLAEAIQEKLSEWFGGPAEIVGTFSDHVLVVSEAGLHRVGVLREAGQYTLLPPLLLKASRQQDALLSEQAAQAVDRILQGDSAEEALATLAETVDAPHSDEELLQVALHALQGFRPWKRYMGAHAEEVRDFLFQDFFRLEENRMKPRFSSLYAKPVLDSTLSDYREVVTSTLMEALRRLDSVKESVLASVELGRSVVGPNKVLESVVRDLSIDLSNTHKVISGAVRKINRVDCLSRLYDALAESLYGYEVSGLYAQRMTKRLSS